MIFYYVYGLLHSKDYRERFAADLKKSLPRIPIVERIEDFMAFYKAGKQLAELHLNYEEVPPHPEVVVHITAQRACQDDYDYFRVDPKMRFRSKEDKSVILYNANIRLENIPLKAYDYIVNGKSAIEWIVERYCVSIDKSSMSAPKQWTSSTTSHTSPLTEHTKDLFAKNRVFFLFFFF